MKYRIVNVTGTVRTGLFPTMFIITADGRPVDLNVKRWRDVSVLTTAITNLRNSGHLVVLDLPISDDAFEKFLSSLDVEGPSLLAVSEPVEEGESASTQEPPKENDGDSTPSEEVTQDTQPKTKPKGKNKK